MREVHPEQVFDFLSKLRRNIQEFNLDRTNDEMLREIREQYSKLRVINQVMDGKSYFIGLDHELFKE